MGEYVDLHVHSTASDGTCTPAEDVRLAFSAGLSAMALTDHDGVGGIEEALSEAEKIRKENPGTDFFVIPGVEISTSYKGQDIHVIGLFVDHKNEEFVEALKDCAKNRVRRNERIIEKFSEIGIKISMDELTAKDPDTIITRAHFARVLVDKGYVSKPQEAFDKYLNPGAACFVPREYMSPESACDIILKAGGFPVLAHPMNYKLTHEELLELIEKHMLPAGLKGMEVMHPSNKAGDEDVLRSVAGHFGLLMSGGSDFHGANKPDINIGVGRGNLRIPKSFLERFLAN